MFTVLNIKPAVKAFAQRTLKKQKYVIKMLPVPNSKMVALLQDLSMEYEDSWVYSLKDLYQ